MSSLEYLAISRVLPNLTFQELNQIMKQSKKEQKRLIINYILEHFPEQDRLNNIHVNVDATSIMYQFDINIVLFGSRCLRVYGSSQEQYITLRKINSVVRPTIFIHRVIDNMLEQYKYLRKWESYVTFCLELIKMLIR